MSTIASFPMQIEYDMKSNMIKPLNKNCIQETSEEEGSKKHIEQKMYTLKRTKQKALWRVKYRNMLSWNEEKDEQAQLPESHVYLASVLGTASTTNRAYPNQLPEKEIVLFLSVGSALLLLLGLCKPL